MSSYDTGLYEPDQGRGIAEIVDFNPDKNYIYIVSGLVETIDIAKLDENGRAT